MKHYKYIKDYEVGYYLSPAGPNLIFEMFQAVHKKLKQPATVLICDKQALEREFASSVVYKMLKYAAEFKPSSTKIENGQALIYILSDRIVASLPFLPDAYKSEDAVLFGLNSLQTTEYTVYQQILVRQDGTYVQFGNPVDNYLFAIYDAAINSRTTQEKDWITQIKANLRKEDDLPYCIFSQRVKDFIIKGNYILKDLLLLGQSVNQATSTTQMAYDFMQFLIDFEEAIDDKIVTNYVLPKLMILFSYAYNHYFLIKILVKRCRAIIGEASLFTIFEPVVVASTYSNFQLKVKKPESYAVYAEGVELAGGLIFKVYNPFVEYAAGAKIKDYTNFSPNMDSYLTERDMNFQQASQLSLAEVCDVLLSPQVSCKGHYQACVFLFSCLTSYNRVVVAAALYAISRNLDNFSHEKFMYQPYYEYQVDFSRPYTCFLIPTLARVIVSTDYSQLIVESLKALQGISSFLSNNDAIDVLFKHLQYCTPAIVKHKDASILLSDMLACLALRLGYQFACGKALGLIGLLVGTIYDSTIYHNFQLIYKAILADNSQSEAESEYLEAKEHIVVEANEVVEELMENAEAEAYEEEQVETEVSTRNAEVAQDQKVEDAEELYEEKLSEHYNSQHSILPEAEEAKVGADTELNAYDAYAYYDNTHSFDPFDAQGIQEYQDFDPFAYGDAEVQELCEDEQDANAVFQTIQSTDYQLQQYYDYYAQPQYQYADQVFEAQQPYAEQEYTAYYGDYEQPVQEEDPYLAQFDINQGKIDNFDPFLDY